MVSLSGHYLLAIVGLVVLWRALALLHLAAKQRMLRVQEKAQWSAVKTRGPLSLKGPLALRAQAMKRIEQQFSVTRRIMIPDAI